MFPLPNPRHSTPTGAADHMDVHPEPSPEALSVGGYRLGWTCCTVRQIPQSYQAMRMKTPNPRKALKTIRSLGTFWVAEKTLDHLEAIRRYELDIALQLLPLTGKLLEIGAGTGWQAQELEDRGYDVSAIDLPSSKYRENRIRTITDYDGKEIPFEDNVFDVVFSSNVIVGRHQYARIFTLLRRRVESVS